MDQSVGSQAWGRVATAIASVFTTAQQGVSGYPVSDCIFSELMKRGFTTNPAMLAPLELTAPDNLRAGHVLDRILQSTWRDLPVLPTCPVRGFGADDIGYVDFARIAFWLFGVHIRAFYYLFFLIFGATLCLAVLERRNDRPGQIFLLATAALFYAVCFHTTQLSYEGLGHGNMLNPRFIVVFGLVPTLHLLLIAAERPPLTLSRLSVVAAQAVVVFFALHVRGTGAWYVAALGIAALATVAFGGSGEREGRRSLKWIERLRSAWPSLLAIGIVIAGTSVVSLSLHPVYRQQGWLQHHALWHSIYYSLQYHPRFVERFGAMHNYADGDNMPHQGAAAYLRAHPEENSPDLYFPGTATLTYSAMESIVRRAFLAMVRQHPEFVFETFFVLKPQMYWADLKKESRAAWRGSTRWQRAPFCIALLAAGIAVARDRSAWSRYRRFALVLSGGTIASLGIPFLTLPAAYATPESIMAVQVAGIALAILAVAALGRLAGALLPRRPLAPPLAGRGPAA
jgi:hypothetical protein